MKNPDLLRLLHRDLDEAIDWAYWLEPEVAKAQLGTYSRFLTMQHSLNLSASKLRPRYEPCHPRMNRHTISGEKLNISGRKKRLNMH